MRCSRSLIMQLSIANSPALGNCSVGTRGQTRITGPDLAIPV